MESVSLNRQVSFFCLCLSGMQTTWLRTRQPTVETGVSLFPCLSLSMFLAVSICNANYAQVSSTACDCG